MGRVLPKVFYRYSLEGSGVLSVGEGGAGNQLMLPAGS